MTATALIVGAGPGLGMSIAHRFGRAGYRVALLSRTEARHRDYLDQLAADGIDATAHATDVRDAGRLDTALDAVMDEHDRVDVVYYGPSGVDPDFHPVPITDATTDNVRTALSWLYPAIDIVQKVLPGMRERGDGTLLFAGGLSGQIPMPALGSLSLYAAALRNYALTLHASLSEQGVYAGTLTIGGIIERSAIHIMASSQSSKFGDLTGKTLDPDELAETGWNLHVKRDRAEATFDLFS